MRILAFLIALVGLVEAEEELIEVLFDKSSKGKGDDDAVDDYLHCPTRHRIEVALEDFLLFHWNFPRVADMHSEEFAAHLRNDLSHCTHSLLKASCSKIKKSALRPRRPRLLLGPM